MTIAFTSLPERVVSKNIESPKLKFKIKAGKTENKPELIKIEKMHASPVEQGRKSWKPA